jgi:predicted nucleotidyltransferase component of viral defense system
MHALPPRTEALFRVLSRLPDMRGYTLVGGTALALRLAHRLSEDLDFAMEDKRLDRRAIRRVIGALGKEGMALTQYPHDHERQRFETDDLDLDDYQQDYSASGVKLSFFIPEYPRTQSDAIIGRPDPLEGVDTGSISVASLKTLAIMKSLLLGQRITTRDMFDVVALVKHGALTYAQVFDWQNSRSLGYDWLRSRLLQATQPRNDPGVQPLDKTIPADFIALKEQLVAAMDLYEQAIAAEAFRDG